MRSVPPKVHHGLSTESVELYNGSDCNRLHKSGAFRRQVCRVNVKSTVTSRVYHGRSLVYFLPWKSSLPVHKLVVAWETTQNTVEIPTAQEVVERIQEQIVETMYPIEYGIVTNWDDTERFFPCDCWQAQDARHHGEPKGQLISASLIQNPAEPTTPQEWYANVVLAGGATFFPV